MKNYTDTEELYELFLECNQEISTDTRNLKPTSIFFALKGSNFNGNDFAHQALEAGCSWAVVDDPRLFKKDKMLFVEDGLKALQQLARYHRLALGIPIIGITGSNGKTTNKELIHAVLSKKFNTYATVGNLNNHIGVPLTLLSLNSQHEMAIVEMGANHQGEIAELSLIAEPDYGLITNIGKAHLEGFGGEEGVKKGKGELFNYLRHKKGKIFVNNDDSVLMDLSHDLEKYTYGEQINSDVHGKLFTENEFVTFKWAPKNQTLDKEPLVKTKMFGHYNFINLLCAACIGHFFGVRREDINAALETYIPEMNRSQIIKTKRNTIILDAYNANPSSMSLAIENFTRQSMKNKVMILGDMFELGDHSLSEHLNVLQQLSITSEIKVFLVGESFLSFKNQFNRFCFFATTSELTQFLEHEKITGSSLLIKGSRGMKLEKIVEFL